MSCYEQKATDELLREFLRTRSSAKYVEVEKWQVLFCGLTAASMDICLKSYNAKGFFKLRMLFCAFRLANFANTADFLTTKDVIICLGFFF